MFYLELCIFLNSDQDTFTCGPLYSGSFSPVSTFNFSAFFNALSTYIFFNRLPNSKAPSC